uniref:V-SNARE coiled-coil homology domain-containing protein n=1 Tax=Haemonchus contortus TaxID=6289 RepID=A0A7I4XYP7_HAECO
MDSPMTHSHSKESRAVVALTPKSDSETASTNLDDDRPAVRGRDAKTLRDATVLAIAEVRDEASAGATKLTQTINEGKSSLLSDLNSSFAAVAERICLWSQR